MWLVSIGRWGLRLDFNAVVGYTCVLKMQFYIDCSCNFPGVMTGLMEKPG
jgi:hypothetical protein